MGLEERRAIKAAQDGWLPQKQAEIQDLCGPDVSLSIDWPSFDGDLQGINWLEFNGPQQVCIALRTVGADLGRAAFGSLKKVVVRNVREAEQKDLSFSDGVLTLTCAYAKSPSGRFSGGEIAEFLTRSLGLAERRELQAAVAGWLPQQQAELNQLCGGDVPYDIDWASFAGDSQGLNWLEYNGPQQVCNAFRTIATDDMGREALREVKKVLVRNVPEVEQKQLSFSEGVLTLTCAFAKSPGGRFAYGEIAECLLKGL